MLVILLLIIVISVCIAFAIFLTRLFIHIISTSLKDKNTYYPFDDFSDDDMKTYQEWFSLYYDKKELSMTKKKWIENSHEKLMTKREFINLWT